MPTPAELAAATTRTIPDVLGEDLTVLFVGINPGLASGATGHHFARPGNRFWRVLHAAGFTPRVLRPDEQAELPAMGLGVTNLVARTTATAAELASDELRAGARRLERLVSATRPRFVAILGLTAYRTAFDQRAATVGEQPGHLGGARVWLLPNPSGLNAGWPLPRLVDEYARLRAHVDASDAGPADPDALG